MNPLNDAGPIPFSPVPDVNGEDFQIVSLLSEEQNVPGSVIVEVVRTRLVSASDQQVPEEPPSRPDK